MENAEELKEKAAGLAFDYERFFGGCGQCVLGALKDTLGGINDEVFKAGSAFAGGIALLGYTCGAFLAGGMVLGIYKGREYDNFSDPNKIRRESYRMTRKLHDRFISEYGSIACRDIQTQLMGRYFDLQDPLEKEEFLQAGGHTDKCTNVCANAARWVIEILQEEGLLNQTAE